MFSTWDQGSGILSIAAAKLGARFRVLALDIDPIAVDTTADNARANGCGGPGHRRTRQP